MTSINLVDELSMVVGWINNICNFKAEEHDDFVMLPLSETTMARAKNIAKNYPLDENQLKYFHKVHDELITEVQPSYVFFEDDNFFTTEYYKLVTLASFKYGFYKKGDGVTIIR
ncbi:hypothetical protein [Sulfuricurvum sp.]|uniref:hypothetical protein n=1 Tax=Sulfuricurvum sp. TaxID=2025608 RepID=UPI003BB525C2